jgi:hypothetical protein
MSGNAAAGSARREPRRGSVSHRLFKEPRGVPIGKSPDTRTRATLLRGA